MVLIVRHTVQEFEPWKRVFEEHEPIRRKHGCTGHLLYTSETDPRDVTVITQFPSRDAAQAFMDDPSRAEAMARAGVVGQPTIEMLHEVEGVDYTQRVAA